MLVNDLRYEDMVEWVDWVIVKTAQRVGGEVNVGPEGCSRTYLM